MSTPRKHGHPNRGKVREQNAEVMRVKALDLRTGGHSYREIAAALGVSVGAAHGYVWSALADVVALKLEKAEAHLELELARVDSVIKAMWPQMIKGHVGAAEAVLKATDRRMKLLGLGTGTLREDDNPPKTLEIELTDGVIKVTHGAAAASHTEPGLSE